MLDAPGKLKKDRALNVSGPIMYSFNVPFRRTKTFSEEMFRSLVIAIWNLRNIYETYVTKKDKKFSYGYKNDFMITSFCKYKVFSVSDRPTKIQPNRPYGLATTAVKLTWRKFVTYVFKYFCSSILLYFYFKFIADKLPSLRNCFYLI